MAFDAAGGGGGGRSAPSSRSALRTGASASLLASAAPSAATLGAGAAGAAAAGAGAGGAGGAGYQGADRQYTASCEAVERELRKLVATVAATRKQVEALGSPRDSADARAKMGANLERAKEAVKALSAQLKAELAPAAEAADLSARERAARKQQLARFQRDFADAMQGFQDVAGAAAAASKRFPAPPPSAAAAAASGKGSRGGAGAAGGGGGKGGGGAAAREEDAFMQRMQQVEFDSAMVDERDDAINDIASSIMEVNETMRDLANIVEEQGKDIEQVEVNVTSAEDATEKGVGFLTEAEKYQKGYRKWIFVLACIIILAAGGMAAGLVLTKKAGN
jgi:syntaxin 7